MKALPLAQFEELVADALDEVPDELMKLLDNVVVLVEDRNEDEPDLLGFVADASPHKQGRFLPGARIPVVDEAHLRAARPDFVVVLPWNLRE